MARYGVALPPMIKFTSRNSLWTLNENGCYVSPDGDVRTFNDLFAPGVPYYTEYLNEDGTPYQWKTILCCDEGEVPVKVDDLEGLDVWEEDQEPDPNLFDCLDAGMTRLANAAARYGQQPQTQMEEPQNLGAVVICTHRETKESFTAIRVSDDSPYPWYCNGNHMSWSELTSTIGYCQAYTKDKD